MSAGLPRWRSNVVHLLAPIERQPAPSWRRRHLHLARALGIAQALAIVALVVVGLLTATAVVTGLAWLGLQTVIGWAS